MAIKVKIKETNFSSATVIEIVDAESNEVLASDRFSGKWGTIDYQRGWWMARCEEEGWEVIQPCAGS